MLQSEFEKYINDIYGRHGVTKAEPEIKMEGSLQLIRKSVCGEWCLIKQPVSREEKWVDKTAILTEGAMIAFYDADPRYLPLSERKRK
jgi:hypothetical protein